MHGVENDKSTPTDDVTAVSATVQVIDVDSPDSATKGAAGPDVIDVNAPGAATLKACPSGAIGATSPPNVIDVNGPALTVKGSLAVIDVDANIPDPAVLQETSFIWCRYPPTEIQQRDETTMLMDNDVVCATSGLIHIRALLPPPLQEPLRTPEAFCVGGKMLCTRRVEHSEKSETAYLNLGEIDMMLAVIMADGRYTDDVTIIPCTYTKNVLLASQAYLDYVNATV